MEIHLLCVWEIFNGLCVRTGICVALHCWRVEKAWEVINGGVLAFAFGPLCGERRRLHTDRSAAAALSAYMHACMQCIEWLSRLSQVQSTAHGADGVPSRLLADPRGGGRGGDRSSEEGWLVWGSGAGDILLAVQ